MEMTSFDFQQNQNITQGQLAEAMGKALSTSFPKETISRWERGVSTKIRGRNLDKLSEILGVSKEKLKEEPRKAETGIPGYRLTQYNATIQTRYANALLLTASRYRVAPAQIIEMASLLFTAFAEKSLAERQGALHRIDNGYHEVQSQIRKDAPHLADALAKRSFRHIDELDYEGKSIERRDVFGQLIEYEEEEIDEDNPTSRNPFADYLRSFASEVPETVIEFGHISPFGITYTIDRETIGKFVITGDDPELDGRIRALIESGEIDIRELQKNKKGMPEPEFRCWLQSMRAAHDAEMNLWN